MKMPSDQIHLWIVYDEQIRDPHLLLQCIDLLSEEEKAQHKRYRFERHRNQFLITRSMVRTVLSLYVDDTLPHQWQFDKNVYGKPFIRHPKRHQRLHFNISHSDKLVVIAVAMAVNIGVDVEYLHRQGNMLQIAKQFFPEKEMRLLLSLPAAHRLDRFFDLWTLNEAYIKACGMGLTIPFDHFIYSFPKPDEIDIEFAPKRQDQPANWQFWLIRPNTMHKMALALKSQQVGDTHTIIMRKIESFTEISEVNFSILSKSK